MDFGMQFPEKNQLENLIELDSQQSLKTISDPIKRVKLLEEIDFQRMASTKNGGSKERADCQEQKKD